MKVGNILVWDAARRVGAKVGRGESVGAGSDVGTGVGSDYGEVIE